MIAGTTAYVYNNTRSEQLARHIVEHMVSIMRLTADITVTLVLIIKLNVQPQTAVDYIVIQVNKKISL